MRMKFVCFSSTWEMRTADDRLICQGPIPNPDYIGTMSLFYTNASRACNAVTVEEVKSIMKQWTGELCST